MSSIPTPFPHPGDILLFIVKAAKKLLSIFGRKAKPINEQSTVSDIEEVTKVFEGFRSIVKEKTADIEKRAADEVRYYIDELHELLAQNADITSKYRINTASLDRSVSRIPANLDGVIDDTVSKRISLDNPRCKEVLRMLPGTKKEEALNELAASAVADGLQECCSRLRTDLAWMYEDAEAEILGAVDLLQQRLQAAKSSLEAVDPDNYEETAREQITNAYYLMDVCELVRQAL